MLGSQLRLYWSHLLASQIQKRVTQRLVSSHSLRMQTRDNFLKESVMEKQGGVSVEFAFAKTLAQREDALRIRIFDIKKLLVKPEAEK